MSMTCTICRHKDRKLDRARDAARYRFARHCAPVFLRGVFLLKRFRQRHHHYMAEAYEKALRADKIERGINLRGRESAAAIRLVKKMLEVCNEWLTDPADPTRYTFDARANEISVVL